MNGWVALGNGVAGFAVGLFFARDTCVVVAPMAARAGGEEEISANWISSAFWLCIRARLSRAVEEDNEGFSPWYVFRSEGDGLLARP
jgi:hypothetical protein